MVSAVIFDFDGVIADSEILANQVLADSVSALGVSMALEDAYNEFLGKSFQQILQIIEKKISMPLPADFAETYRSQVFARFRDSLKPVNGVESFLQALNYKKCIASSSAPERIEMCLQVLDLKRYFPHSVFSATMVERGKPHPDIFLYAANEMGVNARECVVIEDSLSGVKAAKAAGMQVIGLLAASHMQQNYSKRLLSAGADHIAHSYDDVQDIMLL